ncbi:UNVERIFIED_CONTAM: hypothetical protein K2H54_027299 [Gekko kuhli]
MLEKDTSIIISSIQMIVSALQGESQHRRQNGGGAKTAELAKLLSAAPAPASGQTAEPSIDLTWSRPARDPGVVLMKRRQ